MFHSGVSIEAPSHCEIIARIDGPPVPSKVYQAKFIRLLAKCCDGGNEEAIHLLKVEMRAAGLTLFYPSACL